MKTSRSIINKPAGKLILDPAALTAARRNLIPGPQVRHHLPAAEGGCGVTGFACSEPVAGRHIFEPSRQMHNRGNGKGGGIALTGLDAAALGVDQATLESCYLLTIALLEPDCLPELEADYITPKFDIAHAAKLSSLSDYRDIPSLEVSPPEVRYYFVRAKKTELDKFAAANNLTHLAEEAVEDEFVFQNSFKLNRTFYQSGVVQRAFVLSHGKNMMILKIVGYAEEVVRYYQLQDFKAHIWIAHQRYPTKGRVWHPGGAHPFAGLHEALVHNGDFANYHAVGEYLRQRNIHPLFLTDTEVSVLLFDLLHRVYGYPLEYVIEALAPTSELDMDNLPPDKQAVYAAIQRHHTHAAPDGPWFFIISRNNPLTRQMQLIGITDTAMLRPQVFALHQGQVNIGLICSEKQAIDATLRSLAAEDERISPVADMYWNARGGSYTDGGAFIFNLEPPEGQSGDGTRKLTCTDKFGRPIAAPADQQPRPGRLPDLTGQTSPALAATGGLALDLPGLVKQADHQEVAAMVRGLIALGRTEPLKALTGFDTLIDARYDTGDKRRRSVLDVAQEGLNVFLDRLPLLSEAAKDKDGGSPAKRIDWANRTSLRPPEKSEELLVINAMDFPPEGDDCDARLLVEAYGLGWKKFVVYRLRGQRFHGCGLGPDTAGVSIDVYGSPGDYLGSGIDGLSLRVHANGQDQIGQILKAGKLVIHGDVGQTFLYGAKGGEVYVLGNAAGRPMINAAGRPRVVINGTCLDYLAESFMAGDPLAGGGFVVLNGMRFDEHGRLVSLPTPYSGSNLFSLASGGAIYVRDPRRLLIDEQLNGGGFQRLTAADWELIKPYLEENQRLFNIPVSRLLTVDGQLKQPDEVFRKIGVLARPGQTADGLEEWGE